MKARPRPQRLALRLPTRTCGPLSPGPARLTAAVSPKAPQGLRFTERQSLASISPSIFGAPLRVSVVMNSEAP